jgi:hypothetical protein
MDDSEVWLFPKYRKMFFRVPHIYNLPTSVVVNVKKNFDNEKLGKFQNMRHLALHYYPSKPARFCVQNHILQRLTGLTLSCNGTSFSDPQMLESTKLMRLHRLDLNINMQDCKIEDFNCIRVFLENVADQKLLFRDLSLCFKKFGAKNVLNFEKWGVLKDNLTALEIFNCGTSKLPSLTKLETLKLKTLTKGHIFELIRNICQVKTLELLFCEETMTLLSAVSTERLQEIVIVDLCSSGIWSSMCQTLCSAAPNLIKITFRLDSIVQLGASDEVAFLALMDDFPFFPKLCELLFILSSSKGNPNMDEFGKAYYKYRCESLEITLGSLPKFRRVIVKVFGPSRDIREGDQALYRQYFLVESDVVRFKKSIDYPIEDTAGDHEIEDETQSNRKRKRPKIAN